MPELAIYRGDKFLCQLNYRLSPSLFVLSYQTKGMHRETDASNKTKARVKGGRKLRTGKETATALGAAEQFSLGHFVDRFSCVLSVALKRRFSSHSMPVHSAGQPPPPSLSTHSSKLFCLNLYTCSQAFSNNQSNLCRTRCRCMLCINLKSLLLLLLSSVHAQP